MKRVFGWGGRIAAMMSDNRGGPWGGGGAGGGAGGGSGSGSGGEGGGSGDGGSGGGSGGDGGSGDGGGGGGGPRNPWGQQPGPRRRRPGGPAGGGEVTSLDEWLKRSRERVRRGFPGGGAGGGTRRPYWLYGIIAFVILWVLFTSIHRVELRERGVVTTFGRYERTAGPGITLTWPAPISRFEIVSVEEIRDVKVPERENQENLILTGDQNVVDLAYTVRWNVKSPQLYLFQLRDPDTTIRDVAEFAMRAAVARVTLDETLGAGRNEIEQRVQQTMQQLLDEYGSGIMIQGVSIRQSQPPAAVNDAFVEVSAAQQRAQSAQNEARAYAIQRTAQAQGDAAQFEQLYRQYRLSPDVTRRRMYYETMEEILRNVDKTIIEAPGVTPYLALPEVQRRQQQAQPQGQAQPQPQPQAPVQGQPQ